jgi:hypothetical protein
VNFGGGTFGTSQAQATGSGNPSAGNGGITPNVGTPPTKITAALVRAKWNDGARITRPEQRSYWINRSFIRGEQWVYWDRQRDKVTDLPRNDERLRATINKTRSGVRRLSSKLHRRPLYFEVPPKGADDASFMASAKAEACLEHAARHHDFEWLRKKWWQASFEGGTAVMCLDWDATSGTPLGVDEETGKEFAEGELQLTVLSIAECVAEVGTRNIETARWWIKVLTLPPEQARDIYHLKTTPQADATMALSPFQTKVLNTDGREVPIPMTLVLVYYERPNNLCPQGQVATVISNEVVEWSTWPFPWKERLNVVAMTESEVQDRWQGDTILTDVVPVQTAINASWSNILEHLKQAGNARLMVPEESLDIIDEFTDEAGEIIPYSTAGGAPAYLAPPQMPAWWTQMPEMLDNELQDILGLNDVAMGQTPPNIESGLGLAILDEADDTPLGEAAKKIAGAWSKVGTLILKLYAAKVKETRHALIEGPAGSPMTVGWTGKDLEGCTTATVPPEGIVPTSKAASQALAQSLWDRKIITDPMTYVKVAELPKRKDLMQGLDDDIGKAQRENYWMAAGEVMIPATFDDHGKHIAEHNSFRKSERYEVMGTKLRDIVDTHVEAHETLAAEAAGQMLAKQNVHPALAASPNSNQTPLVPEGPIGAAPASPAMNPAGAAIPAQIWGQNPQGTPPGPPSPPPGEPLPGSGAPGQANPGAPPPAGI